MKTTEIIEVDWEKTEAEAYKRIKETVTIDNELLSDILTSNLCYKIPFSDIKPYLENEFYLENILMIELQEEYLIIGIGYVDDELQRIFDLYNGRIRC